MKIRTLVAVLALTVAFNAAADEVEDQIKLGLDAYQARDYKIAIDELNYAIAQMQEKLNTENETLLPEPLAGWTANEVENTSAAMAMMGGGTNMSRKYQRGTERIEITLMAGSPMIAGALAMINNPMVLSSSPDTKPYRYKRIKGMKQTTGGQIEITLSLLGQIMYQIKAQGVDEAVIKQYLDATDFSKIQNALLQ
jgi:hypothetical protein